MHPDRIRTRSGPGSAYIGYVGLWSVIERTFSTGGPLAVAECGGPGFSCRDWYLVGVACQAADCVARAVFWLSMLRCLVANAFA